MSDLLVSGSEREPRRVPPALRRRGAVVAAALAVVAVGVVVQVRGAGPADQPAAAEPALLRGRLAGLAGAEPGSGRLVADVQVSGRTGRLRSVRLEGDGVTPVPGAVPALSALPGQVRAEATVDCGQVPGRVPERAEVVLAVVPAAGVTGRAREQRLPARPEVLREAVLQACDQPDPAADPVVEVSGQDARLVLYVETVPRSDADLRIEQVQVPGFVLAGVALPYRLMPDSGGLFGFSLQVADCARALEADSTVTVRLSADGVPTQRVAAPARAQPQREAVPVEELLADLVTADC